MKQHLRIKRRHPRVKTDIACTVGLPGSKLSAGQVRDLSIDGLKFSCSRETIHSILPENRWTPGPILDIDIEIRFELPDPEAQMLECTARLIHFERLSQDEFHVGVQFISMAESAIRALESFLETAIEKQDA